ncbi:hypothetical protein HRW07_22735 [Streptomyces lunaelactis]|uniref:hypothetical protein n=1 Tax=Streptomyces lunaelactis TaxID=1535768 RepID=UPI001585B0A4|nr:hypothetical protein [Streptomyces lunaelactis]NUL05994.1 hypothetical protein [Streptomyces lunaelactis]
MDANQVDAAHRSIQQFRGTPCRECQSQQTVPLLYEGAVIVSCENCGGATRKGRLVELATA